tara:strand:- start:557 stop:781 length:225 start_codon:yes stop_codon:yes gene_type:complete
MRKKKTYAMKRKGGAVKRMMKKGGAVKKMMKKGGAVKRMMKKGGAVNKNTTKKTMTVAQLRAEAKKKGMKLVKA